MKTGKNRIVTRFFEGAALSGACGKGCGFPPAGPGRRGNFSKRWRTSGVFLENPVEKEEAFARETGLKTCVRRFQAEFGQPFSDMEEAVRFIRHYQVKTGGLSPEEYLRRHLEYKKDGKFPLYLPNEKEMYLLIIEKNFEK